MSKRCNYSYNRKPNFDWRKQTDDVQQQLKEVLLDHAFSSKSGVEFGAKLAQLSPEFAAGWASQLQCFMGQLNGDVCNVYTTSEKLAKAMEESAQKPLSEQTAFEKPYRAAAVEAQKPVANKFGEDVALGLAKTCQLYSTNMRELPPGVRIGDGPIHQVKIAPYTAGGNLKCCPGPHDVVRLCESKEAYAALMSGGCQLCGGGGCKVAPREYRFDFGDTRPSASEFIFVPNGDGLVVYSNKKCLESRMVHVWTDGTVQEHGLYNDGEMRSFDKDTYMRALLVLQRTTCSIIKPMMPYVRIVKDSFNLYLAALEKAYKESFLINDLPGANKGSSKLQTWCSLFGVTKDVFNSIEREVSGYKLAKNEMQANIKRELQKQLEKRWTRALVRDLNLDADFGDDTAKVLEHLESFICGITELWHFTIVSQGDLLYNQAENNGIEKLFEQATNNILFNYSMAKFVEYVVRLFEIMKADTTDTYPSRTTFISPYSYGMWLNYTLKRKNRFNTEADLTKSTLMKQLYSFEVIEPYALQIQSGHLQENFTEVESEAFLKTVVWKLTLSNSSFGLPPLHVPLEKRLDMRRFWNRSEIVLERFMHRVIDEYQWFHSITLLTPPTLHKTSLEDGVNALKRYYNVKLLLSWIESNAKMLVVEKKTRREGLNLFFMENVEPLYLACAQCEFPENFF